MDNSINEKRYLLYHYYEYGENNEYEEIKILGIYSSEQKASEAIERYSVLDGFKKYSKECFIIDEYIVDVDFSWNTGFFSSTEIAEDFERLTNCFNKWLGITKTPEEAWQDTNYNNMLCEINKRVYKINNLEDLAKYIQQIVKKHFENDDRSFEDYLSIATEVKALKL